MTFVTPPLRPLRVRFTANAAEGDSVSFAKAYREIRTCAQKEQMRTRRRLAQKIIELRRRCIDRHSRKTAAKILELMKQFSDRIERAQIREEQQAVTLCFAVIEELLGSTPEIVRDSLPSLLKSRLNALRLEQEVSITISVQDEQVFRKCALASEVSLLSSPSLPSGIAIITTSSGSIEINWKSDLNLLRSRIAPHHEGELT